MESEVSLYDRIGGAETISSLLDSFYAKVLADSELAHYFKNSPMDKLLKMQKEFFSAATGGPLTYSGKPLRDVHRHMAISKREFARFTEHLIETLKEIGVEEQASYEIISHVNLYADEITNDVY
ncbi:MAG: group 1 truncated hemoglobin [Verrucomicrobiales bacterium]|nr:group 1 truncated hemoglobin [Verrucomicrobiales bacterium]